VERLCTALDVGLSGGSGNHLTFFLKCTAVVEGLGVSTLTKRAKKLCIRLQSVGAYRRIRVKRFKG
jgi:hypothetical protein